MRNCTANCVARTQKKNPRARSLPLDCARAFYPIVLHRINGFDKNFHHQIYHHRVVAYQFQTMPDSARKTILTNLGPDFSVCNLDDGIRLRKGLLVLDRQRFRVINSDTRGCPWSSGTDDTDQVAMVRIRSADRTRLPGHPSRGQPGLGTQ